MSPWQQLLQTSPQPPPALQGTGRSSTYCTCWCQHRRSECVLSVCPVQELQCSFSQICGEEPRSVLEKLLLSDQPERFRKAQAFIKAQGLSADAVAELVSSAVVQALLASSQELQPGEIRTAAVCMGFILYSLKDTGLF